MSLRGYERGTLVKTLFTMRIPFTSNIMLSIDRVILADAEDDELEKEITLIQLRGGK